MGTQSALPVLLFLQSTVLAVLLFLQSTVLAVLLFLQSDVLAVLLFLCPVCCTAQKMDSVPIYSSETIFCAVQSHQSVLCSSIRYCTLLLGTVQFHYHRLESRH